MDFLPKKMHPKKTHSGGDPPRKPAPNQPGTRRRPVLAEEVLEAHVVGPMPVAEQAAWKREVGAGKVNAERQLRHNQTGLISAVREIINTFVCKSDGSWRRPCR